MMLILQIALGIVLAVVILRFWREIIAIGIAGFLLVAIATLLGIGAYFLYINSEVFVPLAGLVLFLLLLTGSVFIFAFVGERLSRVTIKYLNIEAGDLVAVLYILAIYALGVFSLARAFFSEEAVETMLILAAFLFVVSAFLTRSVLNQIRHGRQIRLVRETYR